jgi:hypothetical protein
MMREKSHCTFLPLDSRNQESALIINRAPHGAGLFAHRAILILPVMRINLQVLNGRWDDLFSCLIQCLFGDKGLEPVELWNPMVKRCCGIFL